MVVDMGNKSFVGKYDCRFGISADKDFLFRGVDMEMVVYDGFTIVTMFVAGLATAVLTALLVALLVALLTVKFFIWLYKKFKGE